jgi:CheY-like chemotaxis protein
MNARGIPIVLVAQQALDDRLLLQDAFAATPFAPDLRFVNSTEEFLDYLHRRTPYTTADTPDLILFDLNMPGGGCELIREIKRTPVLRQIPIVILTNFPSREDITHAYTEGANSYIPKPSSADQMSRTVVALGEFWLKICTLPGSQSRPPESNYS